MEGVEEAAVDPPVGLLVVGRSLWRWLVRIETSAVEEVGRGVASADRNHEVVLWRPCAIVVPQEEEWRTEVVCGGRSRR